jgi:hypothetical protein
MSINKFEDLLSKNQANSPKNVAYAEVVAVGKMPPGMRYRCCTCSMPGDAYILLRFRGKFLCQVGLSCLGKALRGVSVARAALRDIKPGEIIWLDPYLLRESDFSLPIIPKDEEPVSRA